MFQDACFVIIVILLFWISYFWDAEVGGLRIAYFTF